MRYLIACATVQQGLCDDLEREVQCIGNPRTSLNNEPAVAAFLLRNAAGADARVLDVTMLSDTDGLLLLHTCRAWFSEHSSEFTGLLDEIATNGVSIRRGPELRALMEACAPIRSSAAEVGSGTSLDLYRTVASVRSHVTYANLVDGAFVLSSELLGETIWDDEAVSS